MSFYDKFKSIDISNIARNTSSTLNVVKKIIPVYKEIRPYISKEKTIFNNKEKESENIKSNKDDYNNSLTFFN